MANEAAIKLLAARLSVVQKTQVGFEQEAESLKAQSDIQAKRANDCGEEAASLQASIKELSS